MNEYMAYLRRDRRRRIVFAIFAWATLITWAVLIVIGVGIIVSLLIAILG